MQFRQRFILRVFVLLDHLRHGVSLEQKSQIIRMNLGQQFTNVIDLLANFSHFVASFHFAFSHFCNDFLHISRRLVYSFLLFFHSDSNSCCLCLNFLQQCFSGIKLSRQSVTIIFVSSGGGRLKIGKEVFLRNIRL